MTCSECKSPVELWRGGLKCPSCGGWWEIKERGEPGTVRDLCLVVNWLKETTKADPRIEVNLCPDSNEYKLDIYPAFGDMTMDQRMDLVCNQLRSYCHSQGIPDDDAYWFISTIKH